jgi:hypothetical protein
MPLTLADRVRETSTVTGLNDATLLGAVTGFQAFSVIGNGNTTYYTISDQSGGNWEVGLGTFSAVGPTLARTTVLSSSAGGAKVSFPAGTKDVFVTYPSDKAVYLDESGNVQPALGNVVASQVNITGQGDLRLEDTTGGQYVALQAPGTVATSYTLTLPVDDGTNGQALITDGSGNLSWSSAASGDVYGPASATDNGVALFDGTTGKIIKNSSSFVQTGTGVGIGTASPANRLDVQVSTNVRIARFKNTSSTVQDYSLFVANDSDVTFGLGVFGSTAGTVGMVGANAAFIDTSSTSLNIFASNASGVIKFATGGNTERMRVSSDGNVGIGTSSPQSLIEVNGRGRFVATTASAPSSGPGLEMYYDSGADRAVINSLNRTGIVYKTLRIDASNVLINTASGTGNVGIGTTTPVGITNYTTLDIRGSNGGLLYIGASGVNTLRLIGEGTDGYVDNLSATGSLIFRTNNATERMRIDSAGNVGIGTSSPTQKLDVRGAIALTDGGTQTTFISNAGEIELARTAGDAYIDFKTSTAEDFDCRISQISDGLRFLTGGNGSSSERMRITSAGNVGIGTTSPATPMHIQAASGNTYYRAQNNLAVVDVGVDSGGTAIFYNNNNLPMTFGTNNTERMRIDSSGNVGIGAIAPAGTRLEVRGPDNTVLNSKGNLFVADGGTAAQAAGEGGQISFGAWLGGDLNAPYPMGVIKGITESSTTNTNEGALIFGTATALTVTEKMRIDSSGRVGIGTSNPGVPLDVVSDSSAEVLRLRGRSSDNIGTVRFSSNDGATTYGAIQGRSTYIEYATSQAIPLIFTTNSAERMRINSAGNVTIGTTTQLGRLTVVGGNIVADGGGTADPEFRLSGASSGVTRNYAMGTDSTQRLYWYDYTSSAYRMVIDSSGNLLVGTTSNYGGRRLDLRGGTTGNFLASLTNQISSGTPYGLQLFYANLTPNNTDSYFYTAGDATATRLEVRSNGGIANYSGNNVNLSDAREKTNVELAGNYLNKICAIPVKTFNYIDQNREEDDGLTLGVIAQDVQAVAPELVMESNWAGKDQPEKMRLSIYQTDLQYALMKSIQELKAELDSVKAELQTLKGA